MSLNSSSSSNASLHPPPLPPPFTVYNLLLGCYTSRAGVFTITAFSIISILFLLPLFILVLYLGYKRWRRQRSGVMMSHSDLFTYHMVVIELISVFGSTLSCCGIHAAHPEMVLLGILLVSTNLNGQMLFHNLTCLERYLAVVHPVTYLGLRKANGIRLRNVTVGCAWLLCFVGGVVLYMTGREFSTILFACCAALSVIFILFCSISVLCVLIRPGPGEGGGDRPRVDQSKLRAFYTIVAILGALLLRSVGNLCTIVLFDKSQGEVETCALWVSVPWFCMPSSLVLPLLFLHRAGRLPCCNKNSESGQ